jgi:hypothetical protein
LGLLIRSLIPGGSVEKKPAHSPCTGFVEISLQEEQTPFREIGTAFVILGLLTMARHTELVYPVNLHFLRLIGRFSTQRVHLHGSAA